MTQLPVFNPVTICESNIHLHREILPCYLISIKREKKIHTSRTVPKYNRNPTEAEVKPLKLTHIYIWLASCLTWYGYLNIEKWKG